MDGIGTITSTILDDGGNTMEESKTRDSQAQTVSHTDTDETVHMKTVQGAVV